MTFDLSFKHLKAILQSLELGEESKVYVKLFLLELLVMRSAAAA